MAVPRLAAGATGGKAARPGAAWRTQSQSVSAQFPVSPRPLPSVGGVLLVLLVLLAVVLLGGRRPAQAVIIGSIPLSCLSASNVVATSPASNMSVCNKSEYASSGLGLSLSATWCRDAGM